MAVGVHNWTASLRMRLVRSPPVASTATAIVASAHTTASFRHVAMPISGASCDWSRSSSEYAARTSRSVSRGRCRRTTYGLTAAGCISPTPFDEFQPRPSTRANCSCTWATELEALAPEIQQKVHTPLRRRLGTDGLSFNEATSVQNDTAAQPLPT
jgi:hypothetical protein